LITRLEKDSRDDDLAFDSYLAAGVLLAHRFNIVALMPATALVVVVVAAGAGLAQAKGVWSILSIIGVASVGMQTGYFVGMLVQHRLCTFLARRPCSFADTTSARDPAR
jgi:F0F1-type ATP synthase assembly protein I